MNIAVTGATGNLGRLVIESLQERGINPENITAIVRNPEKATDLGVNIAVAAYDDVDALTRALKGIDRLVLVSGSEVGQRTTQHTNIISAAKAAGVDFIAYTSLLGADTSELGLAPEHRETEALLKESGIDHALLRNGWYWENYVPALQGDTFYGAAGEGKVSGAARRDYAEAAAVVVTSDDQAGKVYELAGQPSLTYAEIAAAVPDREVKYVNLSVDEYRAGMEAAGMPAEVAAMLASWEPAIADGALYSESTDLQGLIGRVSTPAAEVFA